MSEYQGQPKREPIVLTPGDPYPEEVQELERILDAEIVEDKPSIEDIKAEWTMGAERKLEGQLRQARAAYALQKHYGKASMESFAKEMDKGRSTVYAYAKLYARLLEFFPDQQQISERLESSPLTISNVMEASKEEDFPKALDEAEDDHLSTRQQEARRKERSEPKNVETITKLACPECGAISAMKDVQTWTEAV